MTRVFFGAGLAALCVLILGAGPAHADSEPDETANDPSDVLGVWAFETAPYRSGTCVMSGQMQLMTHPERGVYTCELTALERCAAWGQSVVRQSCIASRMGDQLTIRSEIKEVLETKSEIEDFSLNYVPDNFTLTVDGAGRMHGALVSAISAPVEFSRSQEGIS